MQIDVKSCPICSKEETRPFLTVQDHMISNEQFAIVACSSCGLCYTNPRPDEESIGKYYKSEKYVSHTATSKGIINKLYGLVRAYTLRKKVQLIRSYEKGNKLLDIGAGTGHFLNQSLWSGFEVQGLEPDEDARAYADKHFKLTLDPISKLYEIPERSIDAITMWHVLEHVYDLQNDFKQIVKILNKNGKLFIAVPNLESYDAKHYRAYWAAYDVPRHLYHFREEDIEALATQHCLKLLAVKPMRFDSFYVSMLSEKYRKGSIFKAFWIGLLSNLKATKGGYSSQIYILVKTN